ncbi:MAG: hypothetical protein WDK96_02240 [Candidatus Paceibacterota bacterium]|jgi:hypothetical protein
MVILVCPFVVYFILFIFSFWVTLDSLLDCRLLERRGALPSLISYEKKEAYKSGWWTFILFVLTALCVVGFFSTNNV